MCSNFNLFPHQSCLLLCVTVFILHEHSLQLVRAAASPILLELSWSRTSVKSVSPLAPTETQLQFSRLVGFLHLHPVQLAALLTILPVYGFTLEPVSVIVGFLDQWYCPLCYKFLLVSSIKTNLGPLILFPFSLTCFKPVLTRTANNLQKAGYTTTHMSVASIFPVSQMFYGPSPWAFDGKSSETQKVDFFFTNKLHLAHYCDLSVFAKDKHSQTAGSKSRF